MGIRLWVKEQVAKLRRKQDDDHDDAKNRQLQTVDGGGDATRTLGCSVLFARARKHHEDTRARKTTRARSHPAHMSQTRSEDADASKPCVVCLTAFQVNASKYLDYCSIECKTKAFTAKGQQGGTPSRASEWI